MILVINLGLKSIRAIVFTRDGMKVAAASRPVTTALSGGRVEQDAGEWWEKLVAVTRHVTATPGVAESVTAVTVSCSASCLLGVDATWRPTTPVVMVSDRRSHREAASVRELEVFERCARQQHLSCGPFSQFARMLWFLRNSPEVYAATRWFVNPNDYLLGRLSGGLAVTDELNAEKFYYDLETGQYPAALYDAAGLDVSKLPAVARIGTEIGVISPEIAGELGLSPKTRLWVSTYDAVCSVFGTGVCRPGMICDVSGTVTSIRMYLDQRLRDGKGRIFSQFVRSADGFLLGGSTNLGGGLVEWAKQCLFANQEYPYQVMEMEAAESRLSGIVFIPHLLGSRSPTWNPNACGAFFGLERHHTRGDIMRAVFESIAFSIREFLDVFEEVGRRGDLIAASGGLTRIALANEIKASISNLPYHVQDEFESTALGAALIVSHAQGEFPSYADACSRMVRTRQIFLPRDRDRSYYDDLYGLYKELSAGFGQLYEDRLAILARHRRASHERLENL